METRAHYVAVGAFVLVIISLAFIAVLWLGRVELTTQYAYYDVYFVGSVSGLGEGSVVSYKGIPVGRVVQIRIEPDQRIRVHVEINGNTVIKTDARAEIATNLLSGVSTIEIVGGTAEAKVLEAEAGEPYPVIKARYSTLERGKQDVGEVLREIKDLFNDENRKAIADTLADVSHITANFRQTSETVVAHNKEIAETIANADAALAELGTLLRNVDQSYSTHDGLKDQLTSLLTDADKLARGLSDTNRQLQLTIGDVRPGVHDFTQRTIGQVNDLIADTRQLVSGLTRLSSEIERDPTRFLFGDRREGYRPR